MGLVGESGSGKSVTALAVMRLLEDTAHVEGSARLGGVDLLALDPEAMRRLRGRDVAMIFQEPMTALNPVMPVGEQVAEAVRAHHRDYSRRQVREAALEAMEILTRLTRVDPDDPVLRRFMSYGIYGGQRCQLR